MRNVKREGDADSAASAPVPSATAATRSWDVAADKADACDGDMAELVPLLQRSRAQRLPAPSFVQAPAVPLPLWQRVALSCIHSHAAGSQRQRKLQQVRQALGRDLARYHVELQERAEKQRQQQREARARAGERVAAGVRRYWTRRGDAYEQVAKVEFDVMKHQHDRRRQEDLLRETEELTRKLVESIFSATHQTASDGADAAHPCSGPVPPPAAPPLPNGTACASPAIVRGDNPLASSSAFWSRVHSDGDLDGGEDGGDAPIETALSLLDTEQGRRPLRHYQRSALRWMVHLYENRLNGILADEMGLGKTVQTIALLCYFAEYRNDWGPHLIVVPTTVVLNWKAELERWAPGLKVLTYIGSAKERLRLRSGWTGEDAFHVCVTSYTLVVQDRKMFRRRSWGFLVLDEAHHVKNFMSIKWQSLFDLQAEYRLLLTGTPLQNSIMELWSLFHFLLPFASAFRSNAEFKEWFSNPMDEMITGRSSLNEAVVRRLQALIRPFMLRRLKKDVETQLPTKTEKVVLCRLSRRQRSLYDDYMQLAETRHKLRGGGAGGVLSVLLALRKVCDHPDLFEERPTISPLVLGYVAAVVLPVPRAVLLRGNDDTARWRFPRFCVFDLNADGPEGRRAGGGRGAPAPGSSWLGEGEVGEDWARESQPWCAPAAVPWWLTRVDLAVPGVSTDCARQAFAERFRPQWSGASPSGARPAGQQLQHMPSFFDVESGAASTAVAAAFTSVLRQAEAQRVSREAATAAAQRQRYHAMQAARSTYVPPACQLTLRQVQLARQCPGLCPSLATRAAALFPVVEKVCVYVPAVIAAHPPRLHWLLPVGDAAPFTALDRTACAPLVGAVATAQDAACCGRAAPRQRFDAAFFLQELWPVQVRRSFSFPDKRLLIHDCGKLQFLESSLKGLRQGGHRVLIFTQFVHMLNILERFLALIGVVYMRLDGATRTELRQQYVERFNADPRINCMILSTRSGGIGLNLTGADTVIFYDSDWNPTMDLQAQDRCHRIGQTRPVTIYRLISEHTVEESILEKARERKRLNNVVIRGGQFHTIAGVSEQYEDSAAAFAALSDPVNLRSFFHDLDEDATVATGTTPTTPTATADANDDADVLAAMAAVEDEEDRAAGQELQREIAAHAAEEASGGSDDEGDAKADAAARGRRAEQAPGQESATRGSVEDARWQTRQRNTLLDVLLHAAQAAPQERKEHTGNVEATTPEGSTASVTVAVRKRQREVVRKAHAAVDQFLTIQYGRCCLADAEARYDALVESYAAQMHDRADSDDSDEEEAEQHGDVFSPRFCAEYRFGP